MFGSQLYHPYSSICKAAIHDGKITDEGGEFILSLAPMPHLFHGTNNNQLQSDSLQVEKGQTDYDAFTMQHAPKIVDVDCETKGNDKMFGDQIGMKAFICPKDCSKIPHSVFGVKDYFDASSVCQAAIHAGIMTDNGGSCSLMFEKPYADYNGNTQAGITSKIFENQEKEGATFVVIGTKMDTTGYYVEDYKADEIEENYEAEDHPKAAKGPSRWSFTLFPFDEKGMKKVI